jgi:hypothetical protein
MEHKDVDIGDKIDILKFIHQHQQGEKDYRREREHRIFTWSSGILLALIGALLIVKQSEMLVWKPYGIWGNAVASAVVVWVVVYSTAWQRRNNRFRSLNSDVISRIEVILHCHDKGYFADGAPLLPDIWRPNEKKRFAFLRRLFGFNYASATWLLGILALVMIWTP